MLFRLLPLLVLPGRLSIPRGVCSVDPWSCGGASSSGATSSTASSSSASSSGASSSGASSPGAPPLFGCHPPLGRFLAGWRWIERRMLQEEGDGLVDRLRGHLVEPPRDVEELGDAAPVSLERVVLLDVGHISDEHPAPVLLAARVEEKEAVVIDHLEALEALKDGLGHIFADGSAAELRALVEEALVDRHLAQGHGWQRELLVI
mmetsp:Transcript_3562/g.10236  ORF Transcript_3562/g.10236 Transcript_3562/m.10236 type:complete len:205 (+) Transcript_3562:707-1321(+)